MTAGDIQMTSDAWPRIRRAFSVIGHDADTVELRAGVWNTRSYLLTDASGAGKLLRIINGLDGTLSQRELAQRENLSRSDIEAALDHLYSVGAVEERPSSALDAYVEAGYGPGAGVGLAVRQVLILGEDRIAAMVKAHLEAAMASDLTIATDQDLWLRLRAVGPTAVGDPLTEQEWAEKFSRWGDALVIYADTTVRLAAAAMLNRAALRAGFSWLHGVIDGPFLLIGPTVIPHRSACYECFEQRVAMNLREKASYQRYKEALARQAVRHGESPVLPSLLALLAAHLSLEACNYLVSGSTYTCDQVLGIYVPTMEITYHALLPVPGCAGCGSQEGRDDTSLYFDPRAWLGGG
jgi:bacteriocin biosynthesis cyclodehydratase domain-containing protein